MENELSGVETRQPLGDGRAVLLLPPNADAMSGRSEVDLHELWNIVWRGRWLIIGITAFFAITSVVYALLATQWYTAEVSLMPAKKSPALSGQLGGLAGLASLAGVNIGERGDNAEAVAVLRSRDFARSFIEEQKLVPVFFADRWDVAAGRWKPTNPKQWPDMRDAVRLFQRKLFQVTEDKKTGVVTLSLKWKDQEAVAEWANLLVVRVNERIRQRALQEAERNVAFLRAELAATNVVTLQQSISRLLENELQTLMLARGSEEFAFRVVDRASAPKWRSSPKRTLLVVLSTIGGGMISLLVVFVQNAWRRKPSNVSGSAGTSAQVPDTDF